MNKNLKVALMIKLESIFDQIEYPDMIRINIAYDYDQETKISYNVTETVLPKKEVGFNDYRN